MTYSENLFDLFFPIVNDGLDIRHGKNSSLDFKRSTEHECIIVSVKYIYFLLPISCNDEKT